MQPSVDAIPFYLGDQQLQRGIRTQLRRASQCGHAQEPNNAVHGFAYEYLRNRVLDATNSFDPGNTAKLIRNQFGGGVGGPLVKNRAFYFADIDALRGRQGIPQFGSVPTLAERVGNFAGQPPVVDPFSGQPFPGNIIPSNRISPPANDVLAMFLLPNVPNAGPSGNYLGQPVEPETNTQFNVRLDYRITDADRLSLRHSYEHDNLFEPYTMNSSESSGFGDATFTIRGHNAMAHYERRCHGAESPNSAAGRALAAAAAHH